MILFQDDRKNCLATTGVESRSLLPVNGQFRLRSHGLTGVHAAIVATVPGIAAYRYAVSRFWMVKALT